MINFMKCNRKHATTSNVNNLRNKVGHSDLHSYYTDLNLLHVSKYLWEVSSSMRKSFCCNRVNTKIQTVNVIK